MEAGKEQRKSQLPRFVLAGTASGSGKTFLTCGLLQAFSDRGCRLISFKCGPDYIDPLFHRQVLGIPSRNLDSFFLEEEAMQALFLREAEGCELALIEGVMGLYDGLGGICTEASTWEVARQTKSPVVLVVDAKGSSLSLLAVLKGFLSYREDSGIAGVILNRISPMLYPRLKEKIEEELSLRVFGYVPNVPELSWKSRHLGLCLPEELVGLREQIRELARVLEKTLELDALEELAQTASPLLPAQMEKKGETVLQQLPEERVRIAVARDAAFCFYYEENLSLLRRLGAELSFFSPLEDAALPEGVAGLYLGGGYPELHAQRLADNESLKEEIRRRHEEGMPILAECGGFLYLHEVLAEENGREYAMLGVIPGRAYPLHRLGRFGYVTLTLAEESLLGPAGTVLPAHEFHYWESTNAGEAAQAEKPVGGKSWRCLHAEKALLAGFPHLYLPANEQAASCFVERCRGWQEEKGIGDAKRATVRSEEKTRETTLDREELRAQWRQLSALVQGLEPVEESVREAAQRRWNAVAKPLHSLGRLEEAIQAIAAIRGSSEPFSLEKTALVVMCADHGVVAEGVTQTGSEVTRIVAENFERGRTCTGVMAQVSKTEVFPVDIGMLEKAGEAAAAMLSAAGEEQNEVRPGRILHRRIACGSRNLRREAAMTPQEARAAIVAGMELARDLKEQGYALLCTGEMGIGNTTPSSALAAVLLGEEVRQVTGRGAGLSTEGWKRKCEVIEEAVARFQGKWGREPGLVADVGTQPLTKERGEWTFALLCELGGLDIAGLVGVFLGAGLQRLPAVMDGLISQVAALLAVELAPVTADYLLASHETKEPAGRRLLDRLKKKPLLTCELCLGEGSGAVAAVPLLQMAAEVYGRMSTFSEISVEAYQEL